MDDISDCKDLMDIKRKFNRKIDTLVIPSKELNGKYQYALVCRAVQLAMDRQARVKTFLTCAIDKERTNEESLIIELLDTDQSLEMPTFMKKIQDRCYFCTGEVDMSLEENAVPTCTNCGAIN